MYLLTHGGRPYGVQMLEVSLRKYDDKAEQMIVTLLTPRLGGGRWRSNEFICRFLPRRSLPSAILLSHCSGPAQALRRLCSGTLLLSTRHIDRNWSSCHVGFVNFRRWLQGDQFWHLEVSKPVHPPMWTMPYLYSYFPMLQSFLYKFCCTGPLSRSFAPSLSTSDLSTCLKSALLSLCSLPHKPAFFITLYFHPLCYSGISSLSLLRFRCSQCQGKNLPRVISSEHVRMALG